MKLIELFLTVYFWFFAVISLLVTYVIGRVISPFLDEKSFARFYEVCTAKTMFYMMTVPNFWTVRVRDNRRDKTWKNKWGDQKRYIVIANHVSYIDSLVSVLLP